MLEVFLGIFFFFFILFNYCLFVCLFHLFICLFVCLFHLFIYLFVCLFISFIYLFIYLFVCLFVYLFVSLFIHSCIYSPIYLPIFQFIHLFIIIYSPSFIRLVTVAMKGRSMLANELKTEFHQVLEFDNDIIAKIEEYNRHQKGGKMVMKMD